MGGHQGSQRNPKQHGPSEPRHSRTTEVLVTSLALITGLALFALAGVPETPQDGTGDFALLAIGLTGGAALLIASLLRRPRQEASPTNEALPEPFRDPNAPVYYQAPKNEPVCEEPEEVHV